MCNASQSLLDAVSSVAAPSAAPGCAASPEPAAGARAHATKAGSRRRRLWELSRQCHCPVIGVCFPLAALRRLLGKALGETVRADDYDIHVSVVAECGSRNPLSELLQRELEQRCAVALRRFRGARSAQEVWERWAEAVNGGEVAAAFWAALTHPLCDAAMEEALCRDMHMIQHQAGGAARADLRRLQALQQRCDAQQQELATLQERHARAVQDKQEQIDSIDHALMQARIERNAQAALIAALQDELDHLRASIPALDERLALQRRLAAAEVRRTELEQELRQARRALNERASSPARQPGMAERTQAVAAREGPDATYAIPAAARAAASAAPPAEQETTLQPTPAQQRPAGLQERTVLCVGGRAGNVATYRKLVENTGAQFAYHDGGVEDSPSRLDANLAAADMVICQTGCISHNAYWRVKDFCKRHGKQCLFVDNPSTSALARNLIAIRALSEG